MRLPVPLSSLAVLATLAAPSVPTQEREVVEPDAYARALLKDIVEKRNPATIWRALPRSYRADVEELVVLLVDNMDPELWEPVFELLAKGGAVIRSHGTRLVDFALEVGGQEAAPEPRAAAVDMWETMGELLTELGACDLSTLGRLRSMDVDRFLDTTGARVVELSARVTAAMPVDAIAEGLYKVERVDLALVERSEEGATLRVSTGSGSPREMAWVEVEGRWIPRDLQAGWDRALRETRDVIEARPWTEDGVKPMVLAALARYERILDDVTGAETEDEFARAAFGLFGVFSELVAFFESTQGRLSTAMTSKALADVLTIEAALQEYVIQNGGQWPDSIEALVTPDENGYTYLDRRSVPLDPWKNEYRYDPPTADEPRPRVYSYGSDGRPGGVGDACDIDNW